MPPFHKDVSTAFGVSVRFAATLGEIARGRRDNGRPLAAETSRQMARRVLDEQGFTWPSDSESNKMTTPHMSNFAWVALGQLAKQPWQDGDLVTKSGRDELVGLGLAERVPTYGVPHLMENRLTNAGRELAARFHDEDRRQAS